MSLKEKIIYWHGLASDTNFIWFPYVFLKPKPHEMITLKKVFIMTPLWALYLALPWILYGLYFAGDWTLKSSVLFYLKFLGGFFLWFNVVTRPLWNARARKLQKDHWPPKPK